MRFHRISKVFHEHTARFKKSERKRRKAGRVVAKGGLYSFLGRVSNGVSGAKVKQARKSKTGRSAKRGKAAGGVSKGPGGAKVAKVFKVAKLAKAGGRGRPQNQIKRPQRNKK